MRLVYEDVHPSAPDPWYRHIARLWSDLPVALLRAAIRDAMHRRVFGWRP